MIKKIELDGLRIEMDIGHSCHINGTRSDTAYEDVVGVTKSGHVVLTTGNCAGFFRLNEAEDEAVEECFLHTSAPEAVYDFGVAGISFYDSFLVEGDEGYWRGDVSWENVRIFPREKRDSFPVIPADGQGACERLYGAQGGGSWPPDEFYGENSDIVRHLMGPWGLRPYAVLDWEIEEKVWRYQNAGRAFSREEHRLAITQLV